MLVFWLLLGALVGVMAFLLTSVPLNVGEVFLVLILVLVILDNNSVDVSGRGILALILSSRFFLAKTTVLIFLGLCQRGLGLT